MASQRTVRRSPVPQRVLPVADMLSAQVLVASGLGAASALDRPGWYGVTAGGVLALGLVAPWRGRSLLRHVLSWSYFLVGRRRRGRFAEQRCEPFDVVQDDGSQIGFCWDGRVLTALVRIDQDAHEITVMEPATRVPGRTLAVGVLAECLDLSDSAVLSIDVISRGARCHGRDHVAAIYDAVLGPLPAISHRSVWVTVRVDPTLCAEAVQRRGGGWTGLLKTAATAARRIVNRLSEQGFRSRIGTAAEFGEAARIADGADPGDLDESWSDCHLGADRLRSYRVGPAMLTTAGLGALWTVACQSTSMCVSLRRSRTGRLQVRGLVRFENLARTEAAPTGLRHLPGRQFDALASGLPLPRPRREVGGWIVGQDTTAVADIHLPVAGCGQVVGADNHGRAVALHLFGPDIARVDLCGPLQLAQQVVLRSLALGASVVVHTGRAAAWRTMVDQVGDSGLLRLADGGPRTTEGPGRPFAVEVFDGVGECETRAGVTAMVVYPTHTAPSARADVSLELFDADRDVVRVTTRTMVEEVTMVATEEEMRYLRSSLEFAG